MILIEPTHLNRIRRIETIIIDKKYINESKEFHFVKREHKVERINNIPI